MKAFRTGSKLLSFALCALIAVLVMRLAVTISGTFRSEPGVAITVPEAMAKEEKPKAEAGNAAPVDTPKNNPGVSTAESLSILKQKENEIRNREDRLKQKEERLNKLEKEVEQKVNDLLVLQKQIQATQSENQDAQNAKVRGLAKIYGTMKPKESAKLMENLDDKLVMSIISTMTPDQAAPILAIMDVKKAAKISEALSGR